MQDNYVVIDLEMTGLNAKMDKIIELGAVRVRDGKKTEVFSAIINPQRKISEQITELTGITNEMVEQGEDEDAAITDFLKFLGEDILVGQNLIFDYSFLKQWAVNHKLPLEKYAIDTLKLARKFLPKEQKKNLESLCGYFGITRQNAHRALDDAIETWQIFEKLKSLYVEKEPAAFEAKVLQYKAKKQSPATAQQLRYLTQLAEYHKIEDLEIPENITKSEASKLTDKLITQYGRMPHRE